MSSQPGRTAAHPAHARAPRRVHRAPVAAADRGWAPFLCVLGAIVLLAAAGITWVTSASWGIHNAVAAPRQVGTVPFQKAPRAHQIDAQPPAPAAAVALSPVSIRIPAIRAAAPIVGIGTSDGELEPPLPPTTVGWWAGGARPGAATGTAVIAGHINYAGVTGALARIGQLDPGDTVIVHGLRNGHRTALTFVVTGVRTYSKKALPWQQIFDQQVAGRLALVTCGGPFDASTGNYLDNIVAYAVVAT